MNKPIILYTSANSLGDAAAGKCETMECKTLAEAIDFALADTHEGRFPVMIEMNESVVWSCFVGEEESDKEDKFTVLSLAK